MLIIKLKQLNFAFLIKWGIMPTSRFKLEAKSISKAFVYDKSIFRGIDIEVENSDIIAITGPNGSGKSTLLKILAGLMMQSSGEVKFHLDGNLLDINKLRFHIAFIAPYVNLYDEFTPNEHLGIVSKFRGFNPEKAKIDELFNRFNLSKRRNDLIRTFSSGMKQRMKYIIALSQSFQLLFLDEPMTNLDSEGMTAVLNTIFEHQSNGGAVIIATNDERESALAKRVVSLA